MKGWRFTDKWTSSCVYTPILRDVAVVRSSSEIVHHKYPCMSVCAWVCVLKVNIVVVKAQCLLNKGGDSSTGKSSRQLFSAESCCVSTEGDIMRGEGGQQANYYISCRWKQLLHAWLSFVAMKFIWDPQNGCSDTNIVRRMMELPLKLMTLLTVTISRSSTTFFGPLIGRDKTSVALTLLVCFKRKRTETKGECEEWITGNTTAHSGRNTWLSAWLYNFQ